MTYKVGPKGQVVLPKRIRDHLGIRPGDAVTVDEVEGEVRIRKADTVDDLWGSLPPSELDPLAELEAEHRWEIALDEKRYEESLLRPAWDRGRARTRP